MNLIKIVILLTTFGFSKNMHSQTQLPSLNISNYQQAVAKGVDSMKIKLQLSATQVIEVKAIEENYFQQLLSLSPDSAMVPSGKQKLQKLLKDRTDALKAVLTTNQWNQYVLHFASRKQQNEALREARKKKWKKDKGIAGD